MYNPSRRILYQIGSPRKMENPNLSELLLLLEISKIEDLAEESSGPADQNARKQLKRAAKGFRNLVAHREEYDVEDRHLQCWATALRDEFKRAEKSGHRPDAAEAERDLAVELRNLDVGKLSDCISKNILKDRNKINPNQERAFLETDARQPPP